MSAPWTPEHVVDAALAQALVHEQFPELAEFRAEPMGEGWDNTVFRFGDTVFRFPRRTIAAELIEIEARVLPQIVESLPLRIPVPRWVGRPNDRFPWSFSGYAFLAGRTACRADLDDAQRRAAAPELGRFLAALHAIDGRRVGAPDDLLGRADMPSRFATLLERIDELDRIGLLSNARGLRRWIETATPRAPRLTALVHGDLYARHVLVDDHAFPCAVIDWGDVHVGDVAVDLAIGAAFIPPADRGHFERAYGTIDDSTWELAHLRALFSSVAIVHYGHRVGDAALVREGLAGIRYVMPG